ncbi:Protein of unknown function [Allochromatium warmingii]|uniref:Lcl C-terminal domain-containing protein n=1 Tax=Allochromatium warmingii TaxID=61595 RepID=A0A1H3I8H8_ALLWA|nr:DUF1566 domain-containing protein [Allochromatium warmingii]SDY24016.1 Protein of unknown function [Allochromatium warmingii]
MMQRRFLGLIRHRARSGGWFSLLPLLLVSSLSLAQECVDWGAAGMPDPRYIIWQNGTVYDQQTRLMWKQCVEGTEGDGCALGQPATLRLSSLKRSQEAWTFAGFADWRVPSREELRSLLQRRCYGVGIDSVSFPRTPAARFWTADPVSYYRDSAWILDFATGHQGYGNRYDALYVRLVRDAHACSPARPATCLPSPERQFERHDRTERSSALLPDK